MVLSDVGLRRSLADGELEIVPFSEKGLTPNGYDLSAGSVLVPSTGQMTDKGRAAVPPKSWFVVGTVERVRLGRGLCAQLWLRSSFARKGILATFGKIDAGFDGSLTVSAFNTSECAFDMPLGERFCQMVVERLDSPAEKAYAERSGRFQHQTGITLEGRGEGATGKGKGVAGGKTLGGSAPDSDEHPCRKHGCDHCCHATEMPLTASDLASIRGLGFEDRYFVDKRDGWLQLQNTGEGRCFFLHDGLCSIYPYRPQGCTLYPLVFDPDTGQAVLDPDCPHVEEWPVTADLERRVRHLVDRLHRERRDRRRRRAR